MRSSSSSRYPYNTATAGDQEKKATNINSVLLNNRGRFNGNGSTSTTTASSVSSNPTRSTAASSSSRTATRITTGGASTAAPSTRTTATTMHLGGGSKITMNSSPAAASAASLRTNPAAGAAGAGTTTRPMMTRPVSSSYPEITSTGSNAGGGTRYNNQPQQTLSSSSSSSSSRQIVWVRTDLVQAIVDNDGKLPKGWKPSRSGDNSSSSNVRDGEWGWCRATCTQAASSLTSTPPRHPVSASGGEDDDNNAGASPFQVKLRKVNKPPTNSSNNNSPWRNAASGGEQLQQQQAQTLQVRLTIDDDEFAPPHLQNVTVQLTYNTGDTSKVCTANDWWSSSSKNNSGNINNGPPEDLCQLEQLHEPAVVYCLHRRYLHDMIYTYTGKILLALNPFRPLDKVYGQETMEMYWNMPGGSNSGSGSPRKAGSGDRDDSTSSYQGRPPPHIYAISQDAYNSMVRKLELLQQQSSAASDGPRRNNDKAQQICCNQSILVSGESGAGKTVTTKIIMRYLATLSQRCEAKFASSSTAANMINGGRNSLSSRKERKTMEEQVLQSNPILESFGNARTVRNDNSSRFGKFIEMQFDRGQLVSASIETYLLEKVRLISQAPGERNYHVFYELLTGIPQKERKALCIGNSTPRDFKMTSTSGTYDRRDGVSDRETYRELKEALDTVGFTSQEQYDLFSVCSALLHTSNLSFSELTHHHGGEACELDRSNPSLRSALSLMGVRLDSLNEALCQCRIEARGEVLYKNLSKEQSQKAVEALIKVTYDAMFQYIVRRVNQSIASGATTGDSCKDSADRRRIASIGVLDIFGFESFECNSFEQLCINYCNEALQQQFNRFVFKLEQQEYQREGIEWSFISFPDNQDVLDLIEKKHDGILSILDEQCRLARCTDSSFARAVYDKCSGHQRFEATNAQVAQSAFAIQHYAGSVEYSSSRFLEKNKDELPKETVVLLSSSSYPFLANLGKALGDSQSQSMSPMPNNKGPSTNARRQLHRASSSLIRDSVGSQFSSQLRVLRTRIEATEPHYVRCLKPNDDLVPHSFNALVIADQLRCAGVLEAIRVSRVGFPHRYLHDHFVQRYGLLLPQREMRSYSDSSTRGLCDRLVEVLTPQVVQLLGDGDESAATFGATSRSSRSGNEVFLGMQMGKSKVFLRRTAFEALEHLRSEKLSGSATAIQSCFRMFYAKTQYEIAIYAVTIIQSFVRCVTAYRLAREQRRHRSALLIQKTWRCYECRRCFYSAQWIAWWCQSTYRGSKARQYCAYLFLHRKVSSIQRAWKRYNSTRTFRRTRRAIVALQNRYRVRLAKRELAIRRLEARDVSKIKAERDEYRRQLADLQKELDEAKMSPPVVIKETPPPRPDRTKEVEALRDEVGRLQMELEKAHRMTAMSKTQAEDVAVLIQELARREEELDRLKKEVDTLRSRDDSFSLKSLTIDDAFSGQIIGSNVNVDTPLVHRSTSSSRQRDSPVRSDVSLLDTAEDDAEGGEGRDLSISSESELSRPRNKMSLKKLDPEEGIDVETALEQLHVAIRQGDRETFDRVLRNSSETCLIINRGDIYGRTALHLAALALRADMANTLVSKGAVVNAQDDDGETPLHLSESPAVTELLLKKGRANPNIPNVDGICAIHLAVQRRDIDSVRALLRSGADVNNADNVRWFTALHLVALPARHERDERPGDEVRSRIAQLLCGPYGTSKPDLDYQDSQSNSPLHYAVQLKTKEVACIVNVFLENGANPNIRNERKQSPLHLLSHNGELRKLGVFHDTLQAMLLHGADPNLQSLTGCTPLHLSLYHRDIQSAVQLVSSGAELHMTWKKPKRWPAFWANVDSSPDVLALDMVESERDLTRILSAITKPPRCAPSRSWCMQCTSRLGPYARAMHCRHCSRLLCGACASSRLPADYFPKTFRVNEPSWVCIICERILIGRKDEISNGTPATTESFGTDLALSSHTESFAGTTASSLSAPRSRHDETDSDLFAC